MISNNLQFTLISLDTLVLYAKQGEQLVHCCTMYETRTKMDRVNFLSGYKVIGYCVLPDGLI